MAHADTTHAAVGHVIAPSLAPGEFAELLQGADAFLEMMGSEPLDVVADLANILTVCATGASARDVAEAAGAVGRIASGRQPVALAGAMRNLTEAITRAQHEYHLK